jgi:hypothetical protein
VAVSIDWFSVFSRGPRSIGRVQDELTHCKAVPGRKS